MAHQPGGTKNEAGTQIAGTGSLNIDDRDANAEAPQQQMQEKTISSIQPEPANDGATTSKAQPTVQPAAAPATVSTAAEAELQQKQVKPISSIHPEPEDAGANTGKAQPTVQPAAAPAAVPTAAGAELQQEQVKPTIPSTQPTAQPAAAPAATSEMPTDAASSSSSSTPCI